MKDKELWMDKLKETLEDYSEPMPASGWEQLERELMPTAEKRIYPYRRWAVAAAAVILVAASSVSLYFLNSPAADEIRHTSVPALATAPDALPESLQPDTKATQVEPMKQVHSGYNTGVYHLVAKSEPVETPVPEKVSEMGETASPEKDRASEVATEPEKNREIVSTPQQKTKEVRRRPSSKDKLHLPVADSHEAKSGKWSIGASMGNGGALSGDGEAIKSVGPSGTQYVNRVDLTGMADDMMAIPGGQTVVFQEGVPYLKSAESYEEMNHRLPISVGLSVRKGLKKGFSVETGVTYTLLTSDIKSSRTKKKETQKLHYLGIPVRANWNFVDQKRFTLYISGGGMVEKCVYGKRGDEKVTEKTLQLSVMGAVGAQYNANDHIGLYVEPGVSYYFDNGSKIESIRKDTPCNFNLQAGIRFTY